jgi:hypothetical protein
MNCLTISQLKEMCSRAGSEPDFEILDQRLILLPKMATQLPKLQSSQLLKGLSSEN